jgi:hypothetical protein
MIFIAGISPKTKTLDHDLHRRHFTKNQNPGSKSPQVQDLRVTPGL